MYNATCWDFRSCQRALHAPNVSPAVLYQTDTTTKVDKDVNFTILTTDMYRRVDELKAENWRVQKT